MPKETPGVNFTRGGRRNLSPTMSITSSTSSRSTFNKNKFTASVKNKVQNVWTGFVNVFQKHLKFPSRRGLLDYEDGDSDATMKASASGAGDSTTPYVTERDSDTETEGAAGRYSSDYESLFRKTSVGEVPNLMKGSERRVSLGEIPAGSRRRRSRHTRTKWIPAKSKVFDQTTQEISAGERIHQAAPDFANQESRRGLRTEKRIHKKGRRHDVNSSVTAAVTPEESRDVNDEDEEIPKFSTEKESLPKITVKTSTMKVQEDGNGVGGAGLERLENGITIMFPTKPKQDQARAAERTSYLHNKPSKIPWNELDRRFSLRDLAKPRVERGLNTEVGMGFGVIFKKEKLVRRQQPQKQQVKETRIPQESNDNVGGIISQIQQPLPQQESHSQRQQFIERPTETIQRGIKVAANKYTQYREMQMAEELEQLRRAGRLPGFPTQTQQYPPVENNEQLSKPVMIMQGTKEQLAKRVKQFKANESSGQELVTPQQKQINLAAADFERKQTLLMNAALTLKAIDQVCQHGRNYAIKQTAVGQVPSNKLNSSTHSKMIESPEAKEAPSIFQSKGRTDGDYSDYVPSTTFTAQFAHLLTPKSFK